MDKLLMLLLIVRVCLLMAPFILGVVGAAMLFGYVQPQFPPGWGMPMFLLFACWFALEFKGIFSSMKQGPSHRHDPDRDE